MRPIEDEVYARPLRILHWTILGLVLIQVLSSDAMEDFFRTVEDTGGGFPDRPGAILHALSGASILVLMLTRFVLRMRLGTPPPPRDLSPALQALSRANHYAFYVALVLLPLTGVSALLIDTELGDVHSFLVPVLLVLIGLHVAGVAYHMLFKRDGVLWRMLRLGRPAR